MGGRGSKARPSGGGEESFHFAFKGIARNSWVAISPQGVRRDKEAGALFLAGLRAMLEEIEPSLVISYGELTDIERAAVENVYCGYAWYPTHWDEKKVALGRL